ncbi:MAG: hypothetical protein INQ03_12345 [Candidatus Heimdallarchaeota archaeon]|nr:hypothetical protein [Candidatus Heimdallarchaeota archaeon]
MEFKLFVDKKNDDKEPLEILIDEVASSLKKIKIEKQIININTDEGKKEAEKTKLDEVPALLFDKVRISGQLNEYFILAIIAQLLTADGNDQSGAELDDIDEKRMYIASSFLEYQTQIRQNTENFLFMIRGSTNDFNQENIKKHAENGTKVFILTNFDEGNQRKNLAALGTHPNIIYGHIFRKNINMGLVLTVRKGRPFFGSYIRAKQDKEGKWKGLWSPLLPDCVNELKNFYIPLFMTAGPVHLDGEIPEGETNRQIAKVKDATEDLKDLFF